MTIFLTKTDVETWDCEAFFAVIFFKSAEIFWCFDMVEGICASSIFYWAKFAYLCYSSISMSKVSWNNRQDPYFGSFTFLVAKQLYTWSCLFVCLFVCLSSVFDMKYLSLFEYQEYSRIFKERESSYEKQKTDRQQTNTQMW